MIRVEVSTDPAYAVEIGPGALDGLSRESGRIAVVVDENVWALHEARLRAALEPHRPHFRTVPSGERHKTLGTAEALWDWLGSIRLERSERIVAIGGGVTGDVAGFVAATWRRGVRYVHVPTTLLAMVDSSVGGKVAIDAAGGKNLVGAFHQPAQVLADTSFLRTLPSREAWCGLAEVVKTALLAGGELFESVDRSLEAFAAGGLEVDELVASCVRFKAAVVARDPHEQGERAILNLGHTVGHAFEAASGFDRMLHGEAVAWGLRAALVLSGIGPDSRAARLVSRLPAVSLAGLDVAGVRAAMSSDKKSVGGLPQFVLLDGVGQPRWGCRVDEGTVERMLQLLGVEARS